MKRDGFVAFLLLVLTILLIVRLFTNVSSDSKQANVYYRGDMIATLDLNQDQIVVYEGKLGPVTVEVKNQKVAVIEETSPQHLCSLQGFVNSVLTPIICLPNEMIIEITGIPAENGLDVLQ